MSEFNYTLSVLQEIFGIVRMSHDTAVPKWAENDVFYSVTKTKEELSIVCLQSSIPKGYTVENDWRIIRVNGQLDFSLTGIIAKLSNVLAESSISIFTISTYDTDYILVKNTHVNKAITALKEKGYIFSDNY